MEEYLFILAVTVFVLCVMVGVLCVQVMDLKEETSRLTRESDWLSRRCHNNAEAVDRLHENSRLSIENEKIIVEVLKGLEERIK